MFRLSASLRASISALLPYGLAQFCCQLLQRMTGFEPRPSIFVRGWLVPSKGKKFRHFFYSCYPIVFLLVWFTQTLGADSNCMYSYERRVLRIWAFPILLLEFVVALQIMSKIQNLQINLESNHLRRITVERRTGKLDTHKIASQNYSEFPAE